jgi:adenosylhomocysteine nucleosidase
MRLTILAPMKSELRPVVRALGLRRAERDGEIVHEGRTPGADVTARLTRIGTDWARRTTERTLATGDVDHVLVVGIAGAVGPGVEVGDLIRPAAVVDVVSGREYEPAPLDDAPGLGKLATHGEFLLDQSVFARLAGEGVLAIDMETAAVAAVCAQAGCPWSVVRVISDKATDQVVDADILTMMRDDGTPDAGKSLRYLARHPGKIPALVKLGRDSAAAAGRAAAEAARICREIA